MFTAMETERNVLYIDTGGSLSATRIKDMLQGQNRSLDDQVCTSLRYSGHIYTNKGSGGY